MGRADKLARLREARAAGSSRQVVEESDNDSQVDIYEEVDEDEYRKHKRDQLLQDDFIVDDNGEGYVETGADEWDNRNEYVSEDDDADTSTSKKEKKKPKVRKTASINSFFKPDTTDKKPKKVLDKGLVDDILDSFEVSASSSKKVSTPFGSLSRKDPFSSVRKPGSSPFGSSPSFTSKANLVKSRLALADDDEEDDDLGSASKRQKLSSDIDEPPTNDSIDYSISSPSKPQESAADISSPIKRVKAEESDSDEEVVVSRKSRIVTSKITKEVNLTATKEVKPKVEASSSPFRSANSSYTMSSSPAKSDSKLEADAFGDGSSLKMFWLDYAEVDGSLLLFGKAETSSGELASCMVQVNGMYRELYFLPRKFRRVSDDDEGSDEEETEDVPVTPQDVADEITPLLLQKYGISQLKYKAEHMKYAFELPGVPAEADYLKLLLPYKTPGSSGEQIPADLEGDTFNHVFGGNSSLFENFVVQRNVMGPCWLEIKNPEFDSIRNTSHCKVEVAVSAANKITPLSSQPAPPNLTLMGLSTQSVLNPKTNKQELVSISLATFNSVPQDIPYDNAPDSVITLVRPVGASTFPPGLTQTAQKDDFVLRTFPNEKTMLNYFCALVTRADPDVFVGHRLENISLDLLVHRLHEHKITTWSALGRRSRKAWPDRFGRIGGSGNNAFLIREVFHGRLLCDIANEMGQSLTGKCQSWDLPEMFQVVCRKKHTALEINYSKPQYSESADVFLSALKENAANVLITTEVAFRMQILSLSKQLTNLAGNAWAATLGGTRAGRNEFILLHEFSRKGYIVPDKEFKKQRPQAPVNADAEDDEAHQTTNKKARFQGGLVFEPEKGLHTNYVLVMDFNSLYPSIIQEFNICFTTVARSKEDEDVLPEVPEESTDQGVLPRLLAALVNRRREVKKLLKDPRATAVEKAQYDIKQQALKLTANSMYGCLGYVNSRFYAKPLAMLVTNKGREILMNTRQLAEGLGLRVVYGDTDSVMIDTGCKSYKEAVEIGEDFKIKVNERYRLLEIDIDNIFKKLLLHAKKKYAALNAVMVGDQEKVALEVKGLDMKRREYCELSKEISTHVLNKILGDQDSETALNEVYSYLSDMATKIKEHTITTTKFTINNRLSKDPTLYNSAADSLPHVQVALRLKKQGKVVKSGTVLSFIIVEPKDDEEAKLSPAARARPLAEVLSKNSGLVPDASYYLEKQIFAPVERILERIEGNDLVRLASTLGLDSRRYEARARASTSTANNALQPFESLIPDEERFRSCQFLKIQCSCGSSFPFGGLLASNDYQVVFAGIKCNKCSQVLPRLRITSQLERIIRAHISMYYTAWLVCDDQTCGNETRQISVYGRKCVSGTGRGKGCTGIMRYKYSDKDLYNQLLYFESIFDVEKAKKNQLKPLSTGEADVENRPRQIGQSELAALAEQNVELFGTCRNVVDKYLNECGRRYVDMGSFFKFMAQP
ncbi:unnamed protein product [Kuraishia capsulata CBS 1993]|uniref:DNA polymerase n=1 Tax=Kuraishia capsulata CBS 1993 TaxID=1382522 RepID=W6MFH0_9ASCO|nr:uncharacterized protein KUCA_T00000291001 [Kuraishia capsulata CBS 1993]CDK24331.1 unnamed protein product [Kuraishia capsulata CBS 1993]